jgi:hypothetical protein
MCSVRFITDASLKCSQRNVRRLALITAAGALAADTSEKGVAGGTAEMTIMLHK